MLNFEIIKEHLNWSFILVAKVNVRIARLACYNVIEIKVFMRYSFCLVCSLAIFARRRRNSLKAFSQVVEVPVEEDVIQISFRTGYCYRNGTAKCQRSIGIEGRLQGRYTLKCKKIDWWVDLSML
jgi:hypothetical protein